jgi:hypothetical protein
MPRIIVIAARADRFCARLNDGLAAVALVLAVVAATLSIVRAAQWIGPPGNEWTVADPGPWSAGVPPQEDEPGRAVAPLLDQREAGPRPK